MEKTTEKLYPPYGRKRETDDSRKVRFAQSHRTIRAGWFA